VSAHESNAQGKQNPQGGLKETQAVSVGWGKVKFNSKIVGENKAPEGGGPG